MPWACLWPCLLYTSPSPRDAIYGNAIFSCVADAALVDMLYMGVILSNYGRFSAALDESGRMIRDRVFEG